jgi:ATP synthase protein I
MTDARRPSDPSGMRESVTRFDERRRRWRAEGGRTLGLIAAVVGVGWSVVIPAVAGFAAGHWLDARAGTGVLMSAGLGFLGLVVGCATAWRRISERLDPVQPERERRPDGGAGDRSGRSRRGGGSHPSS